MAGCAWQRRHQSQIAGLILEWSIVLLFGVELNNPQPVDQPLGFQWNLGAESTVLVFVVSRIKHGWLLLAQVDFGPDPEFLFVAARVDPRDSHHTRLQSHSVGEFNLQGAGNLGDASWFFDFDFDVRIELLDPNRFGIQISNQCRQAGRLGIGRRNRLGLLTEQVKDAWRT